MHPPLKRFSPPFHDPMQFPYKFYFHSAFILNIHYEKAEWLSRGILQPGLQRRQSLPFLRIGEQTHRQSSHCHPLRDKRSEQASHNHKTSMWEFRSRHMDVFLCPPCKAGTNRSYFFPRCIHSRQGGTISFCSAQLPFRSFK